MKKKTFTLTEEDATEIVDSLRLSIIVGEEWEWQDDWDGKWNESVFYEVDKLISTSRIEEEIVDACKADTVFIESLVDALEGELVGFEYEEESRLV